MSVMNYSELLQHVGHEIEVATYGDIKDPANVAVECITCYQVLLDFDKEPEVDNE